MTHLTTEQLLELREPGLEPGLDGARAHLATCETCQAELRLIDQRVARLRALATPRPGRDHFLEIRSKYVAERRRKRVRWAGIGSLALAASLALVVLTGDGQAGGRADGRIVGPAYAVASDGDTDLAAIIARSQELEEALRVYDPDSRMIDARTATIAARIEDQLSTVDRQIELFGALDRSVPERQAERLRLWNERVGLLNALMDVHLTKATYAGM
ncbi:MAG TPA: hypothetical protein VF862_02090 [Gemmatimonadales bacterium]